MSKYNFHSNNRTKEKAIEIFNQRIKDSIEVYDKFNKSFFKRNCPVCNSSKFNKLDKFHERYEIGSCQKCNTLYVTSCPNNDALDYYYNKCNCNKLLEKILSKRSESNTVIYSDRLNSVLTKIENLLIHKNQLKILEIGCNSGSFLQSIYLCLKDRNQVSNVTISGIDIDSNAIANRKCDLSIELINCNVEDFLIENSKKYDLILHFELIEHLVNPRKFICSISNLLNKEGIMYFHTPNIEGFDNLKLHYNDVRPLAHGIFPPMHLQGFTPSTISFLLLDCGFNIKKIETPGNFDVDIVASYLDLKNKDDLILNFVSSLSEDQKIGLQEIISYTKSSSHMTVECNLN